VALEKCVSLQTELSGLCGLLCVIHKHGGH